MPDQGKSKSSSIRAGRIRSSRTPLDFRKTLMYANPELILPGCLSNCASNSRRNPAVTSRGACAVQCSGQNVSIMTFRRTAPCLLTQWLKYLDVIKYPSMRGCPARCKGVFALRRRFIALICQAPKQLRLHLDLTGTPFALYNNKRRNEPTSKKRTLPAQ